MNISQHIRLDKGVFPPTLALRYNISLEKVCDEIIRVWNEENLRVVDGIVKPDPGGQFYYEVVHPKYNRGATIPQNEIFKVPQPFRDSHTSVFAHDLRWVENYRDKGTVSCSGTTFTLDYLIIDIDRKGNPDGAIMDATFIRDTSEFQNHCNVWFSGCKGCHLEFNAGLFGNPILHQSNSGRFSVLYNLASLLAGGVTTSGNIIDPYRQSNQEITNYYLERGVVCDPTSVEFRQQLESFDPSVYNINSMIRRRWTLHEKSGKMKRPLYYEGKPYEMKPEKTLPYGLALFYKAWMMKKPTRKKHVASDVSEDEFIEFCYNYIDDFDPETNMKGWTKAFLNPTYEDSNPGFYVNIPERKFRDFGTGQTWTYEEFKELI